MHFHLLRNCFRANAFQQSYRRIQGRYSRTFNNSNSSKPLYRLRSTLTIRRYLLMAGLVATVKETFGFGRKFDDAEIRELVKLGLAALRAQRFSEAEDLISSALQHAKDQNNERAICYCIDSLAELYYEMECFDKAEAFLVQLVHQLLQQDYKRNNHVIIEISLRLAEIYDRLGDDKKAEEGFVFCVNTQRHNVTEVMNKWQKLGYRPSLESLSNDRPEKENLSLYGMVAEAYARFLVKRNRLGEAEHYFNEAMQIASRLYGAVHRQTATMMNNYGALCLKQKRYDVAAYYLRHAVEKAVVISDCASDLSNYYSNYAEALFHTEQFDQSLKFARLAVESAKQNGDATALDRASEFLASLEQDLRTQRKGRVKIHTVEDVNRAKAWYDM